MTDTIFCSKLMQHTLTVGIQNSDENKQNISGRDLMNTENIESHTVSIVKIFMTTAFIFQTLP